MHVHLCVMGKGRCRRNHGGSVSLRQVEGAGTKQPRLGLVRPVMMSANGMRWTLETFCPLTVGTSTSFP